MLTVLDEYTREALCVHVRARMGSTDVLEALYPLLLKHGKPDHIRSDNGPEFIAAGLQDWLTKVGITPLRIRPWACLHQYRKPHFKVALKVGAGQAFKAF